MKTLPNENGEKVRIKNAWPMYAQLFLPFLIASAIWGYVFSNLIIITLIGCLLGVVICILSAAAISKAKTAEKRSDMVFSVGALWGPPPIVIGFIGAIVLILKLIFHF